MPCVAPTVWSFKHHGDQSDDWATEMTSTEGIQFLWRTKISNSIAKLNFIAEEHETIRVWVTEPTAIQQGITSNTQSYISVIFSLHFFSRFSGNNKSSPAARRDRGRAVDAPASRRLAATRAAVARPPSCCFRRRWEPPAPATPPCGRSPPPWRSRSPCPPGSPRLRRYSPLPLPPVKPSRRGE